jgi:hypothetical protein
MNLKLIPVIIIAGMLAGCNIFSWSTSDEEDMYYEGIKLFNEKKFAAAKSKFAEAIKQDPNRSEFRYYHAKSVVMETEINLLSVSRRIINPAQNTTVPSDTFYLPLYSKEPDMTLAQDRAYKSALYQVISECQADIDPIFKGLTYGEITRKDILFEYSLFSLARSLLQFRDTNNDGVINSNDLYFEVYFTGNQQLKYKITVPENFDKDSVIGSVKNSIIYLKDGTMALVEIFASDYIDIKDLEATMAQIESQLKLLLP